MKRLMLAALVGALALPGCIVAVEQRRTHYDPPPPPPPPPPAQVTVEWNDARTVVLREYYDCDWDTVGAFEYYENNYGIPEDDLFFCLHISRMSGRNFHEVVFTYSNCNRVLWDVCLHYRINHWDLFVNLPAGTYCPPAYSRAYGYYWRRDPRIVLTNYDCHALFWLRFSVNYYGWQPRDCFVRWDQCVDNRVRFVTVVHREYGNAGRGGYNWAHRPCVKVVERPERNRQVIVNKRVEVVKQCEIEVKQKSAQGHQIARPPSRKEIDDCREDDRRKVEVEWNKERDERKREPQKFEDYKKHEKDQKGDDKHDGKKDEKKQDERKNPPPPPPKRQPPPPKENKENPRDDRRDERKDDRKDEKKQDEKKQDEKKQDDKKDEKRRDERKDKRDDRQDERKDDRKKEEPKDEQKQQDKKQEEKKKDDQKQDQKKQDQKKQDQKKQEDKKNEKKEEKKDDGRKSPPPQNQKQDDKKNDRQDNQKNDPKKGQGRK